jgi:KAP family P-loop domain
MARRYPEIPEGGFREREGFESWLNRLDRESSASFAPVLALRASIRASVFVVRDAGKKWFVHLTLAVFRANVVARVALKYPNLDIGNASTDAGNAATSTAFNQAAAAFVASASAAAALSTDNKSGSAITQAAAAVAFAALTTSASAKVSSSEDARATFWAALTDDAILLVSGTAPDFLIDLPLWPNGVPDWWAEAFRDFAQALRAVASGDSRIELTGWQLCADWLQARVAGAPSWNLTPDKARKIEELIALGDGQADFWGTNDRPRSPEDINAEIAGWLASVGWKPVVSTPPLPTSPPVTPRPEFNVRPRRKRADVEPLSDAVDGAVDHLARADIAYALAGRINEVWNQMNMPPDAPRNPFDSARWTGLFKHRPRLSSPGFVVHIDAPWGGGKSTFAEFVAQILNPYAAGNPLPAWLMALPMGKDGTWPERFRRPWHVVRFNAWQHQHVSPPWWVFYETIRQSCAKGALKNEGDPADSWLPPPAPRFSFASWPVRAADWARLTAGEYVWRLFSKSFLHSFIPLLLTVGAIFILTRLGLMSVGVEKGQLSLSLPENAAGFLATVTGVLLGGGAALWRLWTAFTQTLLPGTPDAAKNFSQGADDPLKRMRAHFVRLMERVHRPVLVIVDDLDRCDPGFVVELVRGMQTILASPRVVYLLLGDRDWIEQSFTEVHKAMKGIEVGPEHRFGGRFVEKAIQFSMVLPEVGDEARLAYVRSLLTTRGVPPEAPKVTEPPAILDTITVPEGQREAVERVRSSVREALETKDFETRERLARMVSFSEDFASLPIPKQAFEREMAQKLFYRAATDKSAEMATAHMLEGLSSVLPANPRQIKRIINTLSLLGQVLRITDPEKRPGSTGWEYLARWTVLMVEWPKSWFTLTRHPGLADMALEMRKVEGEEKPAAMPGKVALSAKALAAKMKEAEARLASLERGHISAGLLPPSGGRELAKMIAANADVMRLLNFHESGWQAKELMADKIVWLREVMPAASGHMLEAGKAEAKAEP